MARLIVLEVNEMPLRVLNWWAEQTPDSTLAQLAQRGTTTETVLDESIPRDLYPSQSWASVGTGVPWVDHGVFWYGDEKPTRYPFYWQAAAEAGRSVGLTGVLHSSPLAVQSAHPNMRFVLPDCFAADEDVHPANLRGIQKLNLRLSRQSARVASVRPSLADIEGVIGFARHGVRLSTWSELTNLVVQVGGRRWNRERLRAGQAMLTGDVFERLVRRHDPDLSVFFTNHLASAMHRYWAATFPEDWEGIDPYGAEWRTVNEDEIPYAMRVLDRIVGNLSDLAEATDRKLVIVSSMGQKADLSVQPEVSHQAVVRDPQRFLMACGLEEGIDVRSSMVPQLTMSFASEAEANDAERRLRDRLGPAIREAMTAGSTMTITYDLETRADAVRLGDVWTAPDVAGMSIESIKDHRSGHHCPRGVLLSSGREDWAPEIDALRVAPLLLEQLGVGPLAHHRDLVNAE